MVYSFDPLFLALFTPSDLFSLTTLRKAFLVILGFQLGTYTDYQYPPNYLDRILPFPLVKNLWTVYLVPDNACQRMKYNMDLTFDYIVVGAGAAGSLIANRLSKDPRRTVLLIEAGPDHSTESVVPQFFPFGINNTNIWDYHAEIVNTSANVHARGCPCNYGKQMSGSTGTNAMLFVCGNDRDYDIWAANGNPGWNYDSLLPFFKKHENNQDPAIVGDGTYHATGGSLSVSSSKNNDSYVPVLRDGFNQLGYKTLKDYNSRTYNGFVTLQQTIYLGERENANRAFLSPITSRPNLYIMKNSEVTKILFKNLTATGVNVKTNLTDCPNVVVSAKREVIISAGGFGSPKILMQSGIGKADDLNALGIPVVKNLSVGDNYQDHPIAIHFFKVNPEAPTQTIADVMWQCQQYYGNNNRYNRTGPLTELGISHANGFIDTLDVNGTYPDVQYIFYRFAKSQEYLLEILANFGFKDQFISYLNDINSQYEIVMVQTNDLRPKSKGTVKLRSTNTNDPPKIVTNLLDDPLDVATLLRGTRKLEALVATDALQNTSAEIIKFDIPECNGIDYASDDYWKCYFKYFTANMWHPTGTCKMGPSNDTEAVVDPTLKVYGINKLRVADASIMPSIPSGNTMCPTYMIGEKAADMILSANI